MIETRDYYGYFIGFGHVLIVRRSSPAKTLGITGCLGKFPSKVLARIPRNPTANIRSSRTAHFFEPVSAVPRTVHRLVDKWYGRSLRQKTVYFIANQFGVSTYVGHNARAPAKHRFHQHQWHALKPRRKHKG